MKTKSHTPNYYLENAITVALKYLEIGERVIALKDISITQAKLFDKKFEDTFKIFYETLVKLPLFDSVDECGTLLSIKTSVIEKLVMELVTNDRHDEAKTLAFHLEDEYCAINFESNDFYRQYKVEIIKSILTVYTVIGFDDKVKTYLNIIKNTADTSVDKLEFTNIGNIGSDLVDDKMIPITLEILDSNIDLVSRIRILSKISTYYSVIKKIEHAKAYLVQAEDLFQVAKKEHRIDDILLRDLINAYLTASELEKASNLVDRIIDDYTKAFLFINFAKYTEVTEEVLNYLRLAEDIAHKLIERQNEESTTYLYLKLLLSLSDFYFRMNKSEKYQELQVKIEEISGELTDNYFRSYSLIDQVRFLINNDSLTLAKGTVDKIPDEVFKDEGILEIANGYLTGGSADSAINYLRTYQDRFKTTHTLPLKIFEILSH